MARLTDTQLVILSAASQREDRGVELPANVQGKAAGKVVDKLIRAGLLEEVRASGSLPVWRRDDDSGSIRQVNMTISLAFLAPRLVQAAGDGRLSRGIGVARLRDAPAEWGRQFAMLGLSV